MRVIRNKSTTLAAILFAGSILFTGCKTKEEAPTAEVSVEAVASPNSP
jgi:hypothetical protein